MAFSSAVALILLNVAVCMAAPSTLVLIDDHKIKQSHGRFFKSLQERGHELTFSHVLEESVRLSNFGEYFFDNLVIFAPTAQDFGEFITVESIIEYIDAGKSVLMATSSSITEPQRQIAISVGIDFDDDGTYVMDHIDHDVSDRNGPHNLLVASDFSKNELIVGNVNAPVLFRGIGHVALDGASYVTEALSGSKIAYSYSKSYQSQSISSLVSVFQAKNNARVAISGSLEMFSDRFFGMPVQSVSSEQKFGTSGNKEFCENLAAWTFHENGLLRAREISHKLVGSSEVNPAGYRIKDEIEFSVIVEMYNAYTDKWVPHITDDIQVEFVMIDPWYRLNLEHQGEGLYSVQFRVPDNFGVFKFAVHHHRVGYSNLDFEVQAPVRPFRHSEYERFIDVAYPYYLSVFSMMTGFFIFGLVFTFSE